jgi:hypothetical protein
MKRNYFKSGILLMSFLVTFGLTTHSLLLYFFVGKFVEPFELTSKKLVLITIYFLLGAACAFFELTRRGFQKKDTEHSSFFWIATFSVGVGVLATIFANGDFHLLSYFHHRWNFLSASMVVAIANFVAASAVLSIAFRKSFEP